MEYYMLKLSDGSKYPITDKNEFDKAKQYIWHKHSYSPYRNKINGDMEYLCDFIDRCCFDRSIIKRALRRKPIFKAGKQSKKY
jgi:hypothetical protein